MIDIAQLREALRFQDQIEQRLYDLRHTDPDIDALRAIADAAKELLTIREAGALIITPDEKTVDKLLEVFVNDDVFKIAVPDALARHTIAIGLIDQGRDALRDAMPPEDTK